METQTVSKVLARNDAIFHVSLMVLLCYIVFTAIIFVLFLPTLLMGTWVPQTGVDGTHWQLGSVIANLVAFLCVWVLPCAAAHPRLCCVRCMLCVRVCGWV